MAIIFGLLILLIISTNCEQNQKNNQSENDKIEAQKLLSKHCESCHNPDPNIDFRLAPHLSEVKLSYWKSDSSKNIFINKMRDYILSPNKENSLMPQAIEKFGNMPKIEFDSEELDFIINYIYENEFKIADNKSKIEDQSVEEIYLKKGEEIAMATKSILGKNLMTAINEKGTIHALSFCNNRALSLTDSLAPNYQAKVKRVSHKPRNALNLASNDELEILRQMKQKSESTEGQTRFIKFFDDKIISYHSIFINGMCLQCHGKVGAEILPETLQKIHEFYPNDKAIDYEEGDLRGMFVVEMKR